MSHMQKPRTVRAPRGTRISCRGWTQEAALRMLMNNLDPEVAEAPDELVVYGGTGKAARSWDAFEAIVRSLRQLADDETLLVQSGKPVGVFRTHPQAPRVLIANANLVGHWATWEHFRELERRGLIMFGQMTAGSWIYIGTQGILQGTYETFGALARKHFGSSLRGRWVLTGGMGGMGGAQPLAATMNEGAMLCVEVDAARIRRRIATRYCDRMTSDLEEALDWVRSAAGAGEAVSVGLVGNCAEVLPELVARGVTPDVVTDQTSAHDPLGGYIPAGMSLDESARLRAADPDEYLRRSMSSIRAHCAAMVAMQEAGAVVFDYGNNLRGFALEAGLENAFAYPGFVPAYIRDLFCKGKGPFRWAALSGDPADIHRIDDLALEMFPHDQHLCRWIRLARAEVAFQGLPARICWLGQGERARFGCAINDLVASGAVSAPIVIGRDHLDTGRHRCLSEPRNRSHARRNRRGGRLADSERVAEHRVRSELGVVPPRRRSRHRLLAARGPGRGRRRNSGDAGSHRARPHQRPGNRSRTPRGRRVRHRDRHRPPRADPDSDARLGGTGPSGGERPPPGDDF